MGQLGSLRFPPPQNPDNPINKTPNFTHSRYNRIMGKLKNTIFTTLSASNPSRPISLELRSDIQKKLHDFFSNFDTPDHPPYSLMIRTAIVELNEEGGSTVESISGFIEREYKDVPCGHVAFLSHHLRKLCNTGEIVVSYNGRYMIFVGADREEVPHRGLRRPPRKRPGRDQLHVELKKAAGEIINVLNQGTEEDSQASKQDTELMDEWNKVKKNPIVLFKEQEVEERDNEAAEQQIEQNLVIEENNGPLEIVLFKDQEVEASIQDIEAGEQQIERPSVELNDDEQNNSPCRQVSEDHALAFRQQNVANEEHYQPQEQQNEVTNDKQKEDQIIVFVPNASETTREYLVSDELSLSLKEICTKSMKKKRKFQQQPMENSHSLGPVLKKRKGKDYRLVKQQQVTKSACTERASNVEVIEGQMQLQEQEDKSIIAESQSQEHLWMTLSESPLPVVTKKQKKSLQQQRMSVWEDRKFVIVMGLQAQREAHHATPEKAPKSHPDNVKRLQPLRKTRIKGGLQTQEKAHKSHPDNEQQLQLSCQTRINYGLQTQQQARKSRPRLQLWGQTRRRCFRSKPGAGAATAMDISLPLDHQVQEHNHEVEVQGQGRPPKTDLADDRYKVLRVYTRRKCRVGLMY